MWQIIFPLQNLVRVGTSLVFHIIFISIDYFDNFFFKFLKLILLL